MKIITSIVALCLTLAWSAAAQTQPAKKSSSAKKETKKEGKKTAPSGALEQIEDDPKLPRVLLIGDSISMGYTKPVRALLQGKANVHRPPTNCGPTTNGLANLESWLGTKKWDVIHFNFGLHDLKYLGGEQQMIPPDAYEKNLRELARQLKATNAKLIWASTTPVVEGTKNPVRKPQDVLTYNTAAARVMTENHITTDDLYAYALPRLEKIQLPVNVHYNVAGYQELAKPVAASIEAALASKK